MGRLQILFIGAFLAGTPAAYGLDFDKEIAKNEEVTITLVTSLDKKAPAANPQSKCDCTVKLVAKQRKLASR